MMKEELLFEITKMQAILVAAQTWINKPPLGIDKDEEKYNEALKTVIDDCCLELREHLLTIDKMRNELK